MLKPGNGSDIHPFNALGETEVLELPMHIADRGKTKLPGNHGQFGEGAATEAYRPLRATQKVPVRPVVPRCPEGTTVFPGTGRGTGSPGSPLTN